MRSFDTCGGRCPNSAPLSTVSVQRNCIPRCHLPRQLDDPRERSQLARPDKISERVDKLIEGVVGQPMHPAPCLRSRAEPKSVKRANVGRQGIQWRKFDSRRLYRDDGKAQCRLVAQEGVHPVRDSPSPIRIAAFDHKAHIDRIIGGLPRWSGLMSQGVVRLVMTPHRVISRYEFRLRAIADVAEALQSSRPFRDEPRFRVRHNRPRDPATGGRLPRISSM